MTAFRWLSALFLALALAAGGGLWLQRQSAAELRGEIALLRDDQRELARLRAENQRLVAAQVPDEELARLRADRAAIQQLRGEIERLKTATEEQAREVERATAPLVPVSDWKNAGRATPSATVETLLWTAARHDVDGFAAMLSIDPQLRPSVDRMFGVFPEALRAQYGTVERLLADYMIKDLPLAAMKIVSERQPDTTWATVMVRLQDQAGGGKEVAWPIVRAATDDGWRLAVLPDGVQKIANEIGMQLAAAHKGGG